MLVQFARAGQSTNPLTASPKAGMQVLQGRPTELFPKLWQDWGITKLCFEVDTEPYAKERDAKIHDLAKKAGRCLAVLL